jgi:hypothetical protein
MQFQVSFLQLEYWRIAVIIKTGASHAKPGEAKTISTPCAPASARTCYKSTQRCYAHTILYFLQEQRMRSLSKEKEKTE